MHAHVQRRKRQTDGRGRSDDDGAGKDGQLQVYLRQRRGRTGNADRMIAGVAGFNPYRSPTAVVAMPRVIVVVIILDGDYRRAAAAVVVMAVTV
jgi:hypothetical protein